MHLKGEELFKVSRTRLAAGAATVALAAGGIGVGVVSAGASTTGCNNATGKLAGSCGDEVTASGVGLAVNGGTAKLNAKIIGSKHVSTDTATDFYAHQTNGNPNERVFEYVPGGAKKDESGLCISQTSAYAGLSLRYCNGSANQEFYALGDTQNDTGGLQWLNAATGMVIDVNGTSAVTMDNLSSSSNIKSTYLHWEQ